MNFGMTRDQVLTLLGPHNGSPMDEQLFYDSPFMTVAFGRGGRCNWIATDPSTQPTIDGLLLVGDFDSVLDGLVAEGHEVMTGNPDIADGGSAYCDELGIYLWRDDPEGGRLDTVAAWEGDFWETSIDPPLYSQWKEGRRAWVSSR